MAHPAKPETRPAKLSLTNLTTLEALELYYQKGEELVNLSDTQEKIRKRIASLWAILTSGNSPMSAIRKHAKAQNISERWAFQDLNMAKKLYGNLAESNREADKMILIEMGHKIYRMAKKDRDLAAMNKALANLIKLGAFDRDDGGAPPLNLLQQNNMLIISSDAAKSGFTPVTQAERDALLKKLTGRDTIDISHAQ
jgi:hypothetical protein